MSVTVRKVAYHEDKGVFLGVRNQGELVWSKLSPDITASQRAPTFLDLDDFKAYLRMELALEGRPEVQDVVNHAATGVRVREIVREFGAPYEGASSEECVEAGMPGWGEK